jgi:hypothetical protein
MTIGSHTTTHANALTAGPDARRKLFESTTRLEEGGDRVWAIFAFQPDWRPAGASE